ncbi:protein phosphatase 1H [Tachypleus tridentatus]|uniref:protein phosphatase 1H n=1 Tax=Tachypleus tridentatus TaxID=6853 RepID=UPI003FD19FD3
MFNRMKNALYNVVGGLDTLPGLPASVNQLNSNFRETDLQSFDRPLKFPYTRPHFLQFNTDDEVQVSADHAIRPIIVPRDITRLPWNSGYAEAINAGKSVRNEDQATYYKGTLRRVVVTGVAPQPGHTVPVPSTSALTPNMPIPPASGKATNTEPVFIVPETKSRSEPDQTVSSVQGDSIFSTPPSTPETRKREMVQKVLPWICFALFDGHAGSGVAVAASNVLHKIIEEKLMSVIDLLLPSDEEEVGSGEGTLSSTSFLGSNEKKVTTDSLITGALESAFWSMDNQIAQDKLRYKMTGGCTALVAVFILGKLYIANAGDSRAIICRGNSVIPMSVDFTPESERERIKYLAMLQPELLGRDFTHLEFIRRPIRKDLGKKMLYRDAYMTGWTYKTVVVEDLKFPLVYGDGKRSRVLATIGVTRGFGDHDLKAQSSDVYIKPFLTAQPEVKVFDLASEELTDSDVLIMGTDGLWDITSNSKAAEIVMKSLDHFPANDAQRFKYRYISAAQDLVMHSRGKLRDRNWKTADSKPATIDDISVFVIPLRHFKEEFLKEKTVNACFSRT